MAERFAPGPARATAVIAVQPTNLTPALNALLYDRHPASELYSDLVLLQSDPVLGRLASELAPSLARYPEFRGQTLATQVSILRQIILLRQPPNSQTISITVEHSDGNLAATLANALATLFKEYKRLQIEEPVNRRVQALDQAIAAARNGLREMADALAPLATTSLPAIDQMPPGSLRTESMGLPAAAQPLLDAARRERERLEGMTAQRRREELLLRRSQDLVQIIQLAEPPKPGI